MKGKLFIVSGPSGSGKSTVTKLVKDRLNIPLSISATTRQPRDGEIDGKDYFFLTKETFEQKIKNDEFYEYANVHGNYYGTLKEVVESNLNKGLNVIEKDVNGRAYFQRIDIDYNITDEFGKTNKERMLEGKAPLMDGKPVELHHIGQKQDSPLAELTHDEHKGNYRLLHEVPPQTSQIDRSAFAKEKANYWKMRGEEI